MAASARGARHERLGEPNEDAHRSGHSNGRSIVTLADGHGSPSCPRADRGSQFAVDALFEELAGDLERSHPVLAEALVQRWRRIVDADLDADPPTDESSAEAAPDYLLYGTTAVGVAADDTTITVVQIGDGDVLLGSRGSTIAHRPIAPLETHRLGATESLCQSDAELRVRVASIDTSVTPIDAVLVATDGLGTAFDEPSWHDETMHDLLTRLTNAGSAADIAAELPGWCQSPASVGGDDTTIGLLIKVELWQEQKK